MFAYPLFKKGLKGNTIWLMFFHRTGIASFCLDHNHIVMYLTYLFKYILNLDSSVTRWVCRKVTKIYVQSILFGNLQKPAQREAITQWANISPIWPLWHVVVTQLSPFYPFEPLSYFSAFLCYDVCSQCDKIFSKKSSKMVRKYSHYNKMKITHKLSTAYPEFRIFRVINIGYIKWPKLAKIDLLGHSVNSCQPETGMVWDIRFIEDCHSGNYSAVKSKWTIFTILNIQSALGVEFDP
jgi:hypothetical protein